MSEIIAKVKTYEDIIKGCLKRDRSCQKDLYKLYYSYGMRVCIHYAKTEDEAIRILNKSFMKMFSKISKCKSETDFKIRLKRFIEQTAVNHQKKQDGFLKRSPINALKRVILRVNMANH